MQTVEAFGEINLIVNNAAYVAPVHKFAEGDVEEWQRMVGVNVFGTLYMTRAALPHMIGKVVGCRCLRMLTKQLLMESMAKFGAESHRHISGLC